MQINIRALAISLGILYGLVVFLTTLWLTVQNYTSQTIFFELIYPGYTVSTVGSLVGLFYGFIDGALVGLLLGWLYNFVVKNSEIRNDSS